MKGVKKSDCIGSKVQGTRLEWKAGNRIDVMRCSMAQIEEIGGLR